jgi:hypothetical protein
MGDQYEAPERHRKPKEIFNQDRAEKRYTK